jgi:hypothetical protein
VRRRTLSREAKRDERPRGLDQDHELWQKSPMPRYTIDRTQGSITVLEDDKGETTQVPASWLPSGAREGDVLAVTAEREDQASVVRIAADPGARQERQAEVERTRDSLPRGPKGDVSL